MPAEVVPATGDTGRAVVVVVHGLNTKPEVMNALISELADDGLACIRVSLYFDGLNSRMPPTEVADGWIEQVAGGVRLARDTFPDLPIYALGFSTGALATLSLNSESLSRLDRAVFLAPPLALKLVSKLVRPLTPLWRLGLGLPSAAPRDVRQRWWTPFSEYGALLHLHDALRRTPDEQRLRSIRTHVLVDPKDELVSLPGIIEWRDGQDLQRWSVDPITDRNPEGRVYRHLVVTPAALGSVGWPKLTKTIRQDFGSGSDDRAT